MRYAKLDRNKVVRIQPNKEEGLVEVSDNVVHGMIEENGVYVAYKFIMLDTPLDLYVADTIKIDLENYKAIVAHGESLVKGVVNAEIKKYNEYNKLNFESINNCMLYKDDTAYQHQQFCIDIIAYNSLIWEESRAIQDTVIAMDPLPTDAQFIDMLPKFV